MPRDHGKQRGNGRGRPRSELPERSQLRHTPGDMAAWDEAAARAGFPSFASWARKHLNAAARRELGEAVFDRLVKAADKAAS